MKTYHRFSWIIAIAALIFIVSDSRGRKKDCFDWTNLNSEIAGVAKKVDSNVVNPWGIVPSSNNTIWISDNGTGVSTLYNTDDVPVPVGNPLVVTIPTASTNTEGGNPAGIVFNSGSGFVVTKNGVSGPSDSFSSVKTEAFPGGTRRFQPMKLSLRLTTEVRKQSTKAQPSARRLLEAGFT